MLNFIFPCLLGLYYERGCAKAFSTWLKAWSGGISSAMLIVALVEVRFITPLLDFKILILFLQVYAIYLSIKLIKVYKYRTLESIQEAQSKESFNFPDLPPTPPERSSSIRRSGNSVHFGGTTEKKIPRTSSRRMSRSDTHPPTPPSRRRSMDRSQRGPSSPSPSRRPPRSPGSLREGVNALIPPRKNSLRQSRDRLSSGSSSSDDLVLGMPRERKRSGGFQPKKTPPPTKRSAKRETAPKEVPKQDQGLSKKSAPSPGRPRRTIGLFGGFSKRQKSREFPECTSSCSCSENEDRPQTPRPSRSRTNSMPRQSSFNSLFSLTPSQGRRRLDRGQSFESVESDPGSPTKKEVRSRRSRDSLLRGTSRDGSFGRQSSTSLSRQPSQDALKRRKSTDSLFQKGGSVREPVPKFPSMGKRSGSRDSLSRSQSRGSLGRSQSRDSLGRRGSMGREPIPPFPILKRTSSVSRERLGRQHSGESSESPTMIKKRWKDESQPTRELSRGKGRTSARSQPRSSKSVPKSTGDLGSSSASSRRTPKHKYEKIDDLPKKPVISRISTPSSSLASSMRAPSRVSSTSTEPHVYEEPKFYHQSATLETRQAVTVLQFPASHPAKSGRDKSLDTSGSSSIASSNIFETHI